MVSKGKKIIKCIDKEKRERFKIDKNNSSTVSRLIATAIEKGVIKDFDHNGNTKKFKKYIPFWA